MSRSIEDMRSDRVKAYNAIIAPPMMVLVAVGLLVGLGLNYLRDKPNLDKISIVIAISVSVILALSLLMKSVASQGRVHATGLISLIYAITLSTNVCLVAYFNHNGIVQSMPMCAIMAVVSIIFWPREWHFVVAMFLILGPPLIMLYTVDYSPDTRYIFTQLAVVTLLVCIAFYVLIRSSNRRVFALALEVEYRASHDTLTGLYNRAEWFDLATAAIARTIRTGQPCSLLFADIDNFKVLNDRLGHSAGDQMLRQVADILRSTGDAHDVIARFGGDEFVLLLPGADPYAAQRRAERIAVACRALPDQPARIFVSLGVAYWQTNDTLDAMIHRADEAMFVAKANGRVLV